MMSEYQAILALKPAMQHTKAKFWPLRPGQIWRLLIISFFIGAWITGPVPQDFTFEDIPYLSSITDDRNMPMETGDIAMVMTGILILLLVYSLFSSIFQFIFVDYLSSENRRILPSFKLRMGMGFRLLVFYLAIIIIIGLCAVLAIMMIAIPVLNSYPDNPAKLLLALVYTLSGLLILIIPAWILTIITTDFVVPVMIVQKCGIIQGWKILIREFSGRWDETAIYLLIKIGINVIAGILLAVILVGVTESLGFSSLMFIPGIQTSYSKNSMDIILPFFIMGIITLVVMTPVITFLRYYALIFLEYMAKRYSLLPDLFSNR